jgi:hypothetical protein
MTTRSTNDWLKQYELDAMRDDLRRGYSVAYCAKTYRCSERIVYKYRAAWFGGRPSYILGARDRDIYVAPDRPKAPLSMPSPHAMPGITKEMLMAGRAR